MDQVATPTGSDDAAYVGDLQRFANDERFFWRVLKGTRLEVNSARYTVGSEGMPEADTRSDLRTAIKFAVIRAHAYRFLREQGIDPQEYYSKHRDRGEDFSRLMDEFPAFRTYHPATPISDDDVFEVVREEVRRMFNGRGTDAHQTKLYTSYKFGVLPEWRVRGSVMDTRLDEIACEYRSDLPTTEVNPFAPVEDAPFGPAMIAVAKHFELVFGLVPTTWWVFSKQFFPNDYAGLVRTLGPEGLEENDPAGFKAFCVDVGRKLKTMDDELVALREDRSLLNAYESMSN